MGDSLLHRDRTPADCATPGCMTIFSIAALVLSLAFLQNCPSGCSAAGICQPSSGTCQCFAGRSGTACESCAAGYYLVRGGLPAVLHSSVRPPPLLLPMQISGGTCAQQQCFSLPPVKCTAKQSCAPN